MISILLAVFVMQLAIHLINTLGAKSVDEAIWFIYTKLPTPHSAEAASLSSKRKEIARLNRELNATSAQDDFAKWARLRRQHDKAKEAYNRKSGNLQSFKSTFDLVVGALRWLGTQGLQFLANFWFSKQAMFWLPKDWVPYYGEWLLSFPRAPLGSISINVWAMACATIIGMLSECVKSIWALKRGKVVEGENKGMPLKKDL
ncbi:hypothetical protein K470DRAFT_267603 [Piedraia hortae CBS 480.64]|uniref:Uncharacterized protein n=1 Tax=Piedraia hortae CBS 480.64 TaxID=1314780 RepID=A0A6A7C974_9PEZI|nr:hypothetical protein K470DRAFT_267603 [Piedraia hortae CBS 480.64]